MVQSVLSYYANFAAISLGCFANYYSQWWYRDESWCLSICHWNLNSMSEKIYTKVPVLSTYISVHKFNIICLSETYLNLEVPSDEDNFKIPCYDFIRTDHPFNGSSEESKGTIKIH